MQSAIVFFGSLMRGTCFVTVFTVGFWLYESEPYEPNVISRSCELSLKSLPNTRAELAVAVLKLQSSTCHAAAAAAAPH